MILKRKFRSEIYRDNKKKTIEIYILPLDTDESWFAKTRELNNSEIFKKKCLLYYFEDRKIGDKEFKGARKGQFQTQYISFYKCLVERAVKKYVKNPRYEKYDKNTYYLKALLLEKQKVTNS